MRILLFGSDGQLAQDVKKAFESEEVIGLSHKEADICNAQALQTLAEKHKPDCLINTAAFHRVDDCEDQAEKSFQVNASAVYGLARVANRVEAVLVHFSSDYVFDGNRSKPYVEADPANPQSVYAISKLAGELIVRRYARKYFLVRTSGLYGLAGAGGKGGNFVQTMLRRAREGKAVRVVDDQVLTPTSTKDLAEKLVPLLHSDKYGLYHMTNTGECSWYEFAKEIFRLAGLTPDLQPTTTAAFGAKATRPSYSVLDNKAFRQAGFPEFRPWQEALKEYLRQTGEP